MRSNRRLGAGASVLMLALVPVLMMASGAPAYGQSATGAPAAALRGLVPRVRLFCSPCFDDYAQELWVRSIGWPGDTPERTWTRSRGAMWVVEPPTGEAAPRVLINGSAFDPTIVYVFTDGEWVNLAVLLGLPPHRALPTLPGYIQVEAAPIRGDPTGDWGR